MKKMMITTLAMLSVTAMATETTKPAEQAAVQPQVALRVVDLSGKAPRVIEGTKVSRSKKQQLCWVSNVQANGRMFFAEAFYTPSAMNFTSEGMTVKASEDKKEFIISGFIQPKDNEFIQRCWKFENKDPIGKYGIDVQIGGGEDRIIFTGLKFEVVK